MKEGKAVTINLSLLLFSTYVYWRSLPWCVSPQLGRISCLMDTVLRTDRYWQVDGAAGHCVVLVFRSFERAYRLWE